MKLKLSLLLTLFCLLLNARPPDSQTLLERGRLLYRLELGSWYGTDNFLANFPELMDSAGGYLSYITPDDEVVNIFYSRTKPVQVLVRFTFETIPNAYPVSVDSDNREPTQLERELIEIRSDAIARVNADSEGFFTYYQNTSLNPIPLILGKQRMVYILTATKENGVLLIGNDYLLTYDNKNKLKKKTKIHNTLLQYPYQGEGEELSSTFHSHINSDLIDVTDICTLLLYKNFLEWNTHYVISGKYVSIFDLEKEELVIITRKAWDRIEQHSEETKNQD